MFTNLIESASHVREFRRRSSFFLITVATYAVILFAAGIVSVYAYDAQLESQTNSLELLSWVPPVAPVPHDVRPAVPRPRSNNSSNSANVPTRPVLYENPSNPRTPPQSISAAPNLIPPAPPYAIERPYISDPGPSGPPMTSSCVTCSDGNASGPPRVVETTPPPPPPVRPQTQKLTSTVLVSKAVSLPQPSYPMIAKQIHAQGPVNVQILVDEQGRVVSAQVLNGHPTLLAAAKDAAMRARFTPTVLNGQPVKIQGVITYNFVLQ
jgi:periplasmic protein TonB